VRHAALPRGDVNGSQSKGHVFPKPRTRGCAFDFSNRGNAVNDGYFLKSVGAENAFPQNALEPIFSNCIVHRQYAAFNKKRFPKREV
jgi:hypothetical protein